MGAAAFVYFYDEGHKDTIAKGVRVAGVDVGGLKPAAAEAKVRRVYVSRLARPVHIRYGKQHFTLTAHQARVVVGVEPAVQAALARSREGNVIARTWRGVTGE